MLFRSVILETMLAKAEKVIPPTVRRYNVVIIEYRKKLVPVLAASWAEAEARYGRCGRTAKWSSVRTTLPGL